jgi:hypothetical protein
VNADIAIERDSPVAYELRKLAGRAAASEIHLEESLLRVQEPGGPDDILARAAANPGHSQPVAIDGDGGGEAGESDLSVQNREAGPQPGARPHGARAREEEQAQEGDQEYAGEPPTHNVACYR